VGHSSISLIFTISFWNYERMLWRGCKSNKN